MRVINVSDIKNLEDGESITSIQGVITKSFPPKSGGEGEKAWTVQNLSFKDSTGEMRMTAWNHEDLSNLLNKQIVISSHKGDKGLSGIYVEDSSWADKKSGEQKQARQIKLTATAQIHVASSEPPVANKVQDSTVILDKEESVSAYKHGLMRVLNAIYTNYRGLKVLKAQLEVDGITLTPDQMQAAAASAFITLERGGLVANMPDAPLWGAKEQLKKTVEQELKEPTSEDIPW